MKSPQILLISVVFLFLLSTSFFTVRETETALVVRLGELHQLGGEDAQGLSPGLHFKIPFIETVQYIDKRLQTLDFSKTRIVTAEKKDVIVDSFVKWRVLDTPRFFKTTGASKLQAEQLLRQKVFDSIRAEFGLRTIKEVVSGERAQIMETIRAKANTSASALGIEIVDARVKAIDLPVEVSDAVFERMRTERERIAAEHRAQGKEKAEAMRADADATVTVILAEAQAEAETIRGEGEAEAAHIYADAYSKDADFFNVMRTLDSYRKSFLKNNNVLVSQQDGDFFEFFKHIPAKH